ncbi:hypothetical protein N7448_005937 [Penicillium atrosanguineum]|nr:hypothetical protein N7448_005937 [Penicillium atrosanguineum]
MASQSPPPGDPNFSFAKIAAMSAIPNPHSSSASVESNSSQLATTSHVSESFNTGAPLPPHSLNTIKQKIASSDPAVDHLGRAVQDIDITLQTDREGSGSSIDDQENILLKRENSFEDDRTHISNSSTKMTNFDSKSLASVTTFAMDEKDSVRPDDSASVQAIDEEESLSGATSGAPNSVSGSEAGGRLFRDQFRDGNPLRSRGVLPVPGPLFNDGDSHSVANNFIIAANPDGLSDGSSIHGFPLEPDEKLLEAMKSPKDRLTVLQLEERIRYFIKESTEQSLELPPSNGFQRLLAHKLGDYYHLTHFVDNNVTSVRLHRTPFCRLPEPISAVHAATSTTPPPSVPAMKIMRRNDDRRSAEGSIAASSSVQSKATSEAGDSGAEGDRAGSSADTKDRMTLTREEREAKYQEVRERIFRDFPDSVKSDTTSGESNPDMSRSSSTSGRRKNNRQRTPHDDSFEARSQFNAYYPGMQYNNGQSQAPYNVGGNDGSYATQQVPYLVGPGVPPPATGYMPAGQNSTVHPGQMGGVNNPPQYPMAMSPQMASNGSWQGGSMPQQSPFAGYASMSQSGMINQGMMNQPLPSTSSPAMNTFPMPQSAQYQPNPQWGSPPYSGNYQQSPQRNQAPVHWPNYPSQSMTSNLAAYPYAQYPGQHLNPTLQNTGSSVMPGNYNARSHFNPQTRSFIPGGAPSTRNPSRGAQHPMQPFNGMPQASWMAYPEPNPQNRGMEHPSAASTARVPNLPNLPNPGRDSIAKWGTPSHLPPKPPPSEVKSGFDMKHRMGPPPVPAPSYPGNGIPVAQNGPLVITGGATVSKTN